MVEFKPGDVVVLKSGGPPMTVERVVRDGVLKVVWFNDSEYQAERFRSASLEGLSDLKHAHGLLGRCTEWMRNSGLTFGGKTDADRLYSEIVDFSIKQHQDGLNQ